MTNKNTNIQDVVEQTLKELDRHTQKELEKAHQLRKKIGLADIAKTEISISLYSGYGIASVDHNPITEETYINIELIPCVAELQKSKREYIEIMQYFNVFRELIDAKVDSNIILSFIYLEKPDLKKLIIALSENGEETIKKLQAKLGVMGVNIEDCFKFINGDAERIRDSLENVLPEMKKLYEESSIVPTLLHEIDHIDFMDTDLYKDIREADRRSMEKIKKRKHIKEFAEARLELLAKESEVLPLLETRGIIYDFIGEYDGIEEGYINKLRANSKEIAGKVINKFIKGYVNDEFLDMIVGCAVLQEWAEGNMDKTTANYISGTVKIPKKLKEANKDLTKPKGVNPEVADRVLYEELPKWQKKFADNAVKTTEASINAMVNNPEGFEKARSAKTLDQYISLLLEVS